MELHLGIPCIMFSYIMKFEEQLGCLALPWASVQMCVPVNVDISVVWAKGTRPRRIQMDPI